MYTMTFIVYPEMCPLDQYTLYSTITPTLPSYPASSGPSSKA